MNPTDRCAVIENEAGELVGIWFRDDFDLTELPMGLSVKFHRVADVAGIVERKMRAKEQGR